MPGSEVRTILASDCGSTTTKAILIERQGGEYRLVTRGEAPTTVEAPFDDVTVGVTNAVREVEELSGRTILDENGKIITPTAADGSTVTHLTEMAEMLRSADPKPRLGIGLKLPIIYAGNVEARKPVEEIL